MCPQADASGQVYELKPSALSLPSLPVGTLFNLHTEKGVVPSISVGQLNGDGGELLVGSHERRRNVVG